MKDEILLKTENLQVSIGSKKILKGINLQLKSGEVHAIFGPNGSGKTTLLNALMGFASYDVKGKIFFKGKNIVNLPINQRAKLGMGMSFQRPPAIKGVRLKQLITVSAKRNGKLLEEYAQKLHLEDFLPREVNVGFSGGEIKRSEILQLILQNPDLIFLDEPESGVDIENIALIGKFTKQLLGRGIESKKGKTIKEISREQRKSGFIITHTGHILDYVDVDIGHVLMDGQIVCRANPREILHTVRKSGFEECARCLLKEVKHGKK
jgi:Fe-S cluster assembly ATP-binding protein